MNTTNQLNTFNQNTQTGTQSLDFYVERDGEYRFDLVTDNTDSINFDSGFEIKFVTIATSDRNTFNDIKVFYQAYLLGKYWQSVSYWFIPREIL